MSSSVDDECSYILPSEAVFNSIAQSRPHVFAAGYHPIVALPSSNLLSSTATAKELLTQAVESQSLAIVKRLLRAIDLTAIKVDDDLYTNEYSLSTSVLAFASRCGHVETLQALLEAGFPASPIALQEACGEGHESVVKLLLEAGADPTRTFSLLDASSAGHEGVVELLLQAGAPVRQDAFEAACAGGHGKVVELLLRAGAHTMNGRALFLASKAGQERLVQLLLSAGAVDDQDAERAFYAAVRFGRVGTVALFLRANVDIDAWGVEALCIALRMGYLNIVKLLIDAGVDVREARHHLIADASAGDLEQIERLLLAAGCRGPEEDDEALETDEIADDERQLAAFSDPETLGRQSGKAADTAVLPKGHSMKPYIAVGDTMEESENRDDDFVIDSRNYQATPKIKAKKQGGWGDMTGWANNPFGH